MEVTGSVSGSEVAESWLRGEVWSSRNDNDTRGAIREAGYDPDELDDEGTAIDWLKLFRRSRHRHHLAEFPGDLTWLRAVVNLDEVARLRHPANTRSWTIEICPDREISKGATRAGGSLAR